MAPICAETARGHGQVAIRRIRATLISESADKYESMDDKPQNVPVQPDLGASIRQARVENAERADAIAEVRELEIVRLKALESALEPVVDQAPQGLDLFDLALTQSEINLLDKLVPDKSAKRPAIKTISYYLIKIAKLGGYLARANDGPPGNKVIWRGLSRLVGIEFAVASG